MLSAARCLSHHVGVALGADDAPRVAEVDVVADDLLLPAAATKHHHVHPARPARSSIPAASQPGLTRTALRSQRSEQRCRRDAPRSSRSHCAAAVVRRAFALMCRRRAVPQGASLPRRRTASGAPERRPAVLLRLGAPLGERAVDRRLEQRQAAHLQDGRPASTSQAHTRLSAATA